MRLAQNLVLFDYVTSLLGGDYPRITEALQSTVPGARADGQSFFLGALEGRIALAISPDRLAEHDSNILRHEASIARSRADLHLTYFQYLAALYADIYLAALVADPGRLLQHLRRFRDRRHPTIPQVEPDDLRHLAFWMATGSGKTLMAHMNLLQWQFHKPFEADNVILLTPSEALSRQHLAELALSGIAAHHAIWEPEGGGVHVLEITKLYVDERADGAPRGGVSLGTSWFEGRNLVIVDEGHKGTATVSEAREERRWRDIRRSLEGDRGFSLEYSATFAQITEQDDGLLYEYAKSVLFDYGYRRFWGDGYGKDYEVVNLRTEGAFDADELLLSGLLAAFEQKRLYDDRRAEFASYNLEGPLMVFVGSTVTGASDSDVISVLRFLNRFLSEPTWSVSHIAAIVSGTSGLPRDLLSHGYPYLRRLGTAASALYEDVCGRFFHGTGPLVLHLLSEADGEIGLRAANSRHDEYFGVVNVGNASGLQRLAQVAGISAGEDDRLSGSLFESINSRDTKINVLVGSKKFVEGWSSWRVSVMGLLRVGRTAGPQVIQLFGRGVRLKGKDMRLRRSASLPGDHPEFIGLLETLHIFGLKADYMQVFDAAIRTEGLPAPVYRELPVDIPVELASLGLMAPDASGYDFPSHVLEFDPSKLSRDVEIDLGARFSVGHGPEGLHAAGAEIELQDGAFPHGHVDTEALFLSALNYKRLRGWPNLFITRGAIRALLATRVRLRAPADLFIPSSDRHRALIASAGQDAIKKALDRFTYAEQRRRETASLSLAQITDAHLDFPVIPNIRPIHGYRLAVPVDLVAEVDEVLALVAAGTAPLEDVAEPLPRLHIGPHLYNPLLMANAEALGAGNRTLFGHALGVKSSPPGLVRGEIRFLRDLRRAWLDRSAPRWRGYELYVLRNLPQKGIGFFETAGFYPDFLLWLKKGDAQALAFVEPHGLVNWDQAKVDLLADIREMRLGVPMVGFIVTETEPADVGAGGGIRRGEEWYRERGVLFQRSADHIETILTELRACLPSRRS